MYTKRTTDLMQNMCSVGHSLHMTIVSKNKFVHRERKDPTGGNFKR